MLPSLSLHQFLPVNFSAWGSQWSAVGGSIPAQPVYLLPCIISSSTPSSLVCNLRASSPLLGLDLASLSSTFLLKSKVSCLSSPQTPLQCRCLILCFSSHGRLNRPHWTLYYRPIRVPDSFTFGCPAPRLGLTLARLAACLPATLAFAQLRLCCFGPLLSLFGPR